MKITKTRLKQIIKEELDIVLKENDMENWNNFVNEEEQVEEGIMDTIRQTARDFTGKLGGARRMRDLASRLLYDTFDPRSNEFFSDSDNLIGMLRSHGVDWARSEAGGETIVDADELSQIISAYREDPEGQYERFKSAMLNLKKTLDAYIKGK